MSELDAVGFRLVPELSAGAAPAIDEVDAFGFLLVPELGFGVARAMSERRDRTISGFGLPLTVGSRVVGTQVMGERIEQTIDTGGLQLVLEHSVGEARA